MNMNISKLERDTLLEWKGSPGVQFPEEEALAALLQKHPGGPIELNENQVVILSSWAEANVDKHFGAGAITNVVEGGLLKKITDLYENLPAPETARDGGKTTGITRGTGQPADAARQNRTAGPIFRAALVALAAVIALYLWHKKTMKPEIVPEQAGAQTYGVSYVVGEVLIKKSGAWERLEMGGSVMSTDSVKTGRASETTIANAKKSFTISEERTLKVQDLE